MKKILLGILVAISIASCTETEKKTELTQQQKDRQRIDSLETRIKASIEKAENPDVQLAMAAIKNYLYFAHDYPEDSLAADYMFKAAQIYEGVLRDYPKAVEYYQKIYEKYPDYRKRPMMLFYQGNTYHQMGDTVNAIFNFQRFAETYPNHDFADDAEAMIRFIRMDENQMKEFFNKAKNDSQAVQ